MKTLTIISIFILSILQVNAQEADNQTEKKGFIIVAAGKNYDAIKEQAIKVSTQLNYKLDLRGLSKNSTEGLTFSEAECEQEGFEFPTYIARGRYDDGNYVSIEYTNAYEGFTPELYIIIVSSYSEGDKELTKSLSFVKKYYKSAYIKYADIYIGCIH